MFTADGSDEPDVCRRIGIAKARADQLHHVLGSVHVPMETKVKLYNAAVGSLFTYGCEGWELSPPTLRRLNGANSKLLSHFTGKTIVQEARPATTSYNLNLGIRKRRLCWLGHILRMDSNRMVRAAAEEQFAKRRGGDLAIHGRSDKHEFDGIEDFVVRR